MFATLSVSLYLAWDIPVIFIEFLHFNERIETTGKRSGVSFKLNSPPSSNFVPITFIFPFLLSTVISAPISFTMLIILESPWGKEKSRLSMVNSPSPNIAEEISNAAVEKSPGTLKVVGE